MTFGDFELDVAGYELRRAGRPVKLERLAMELLLLLVGRPGQLVTRDEILHRLWGTEVFLDVDNSINTAISKLRSALRDDPEKPRFIKTIPGKGYRFIAPIMATGTVAETAPIQTPSQPVNPEPGRRRAGRRWSSIGGTAAIAAALAAWLALGPQFRTPTIRSLAVLPLENLTGDPSQEYFADGMTDALITDLAQIGSLRVISRTSVARYKGVRKAISEIAHELGVDGIVEGTVTRSGGRVRVTSQLIYAARDQHLWARSYERDVGDIVSLQADIAQAIAGEVRAIVTPEQRSRLTASRPVKGDAYDAYLRGRHFLNQRTPAATKRSVEFFRQAVESDPNFALAHASLAEAYNFANAFSGLAPRETSPVAKAAATRALELDPQLAEAHAALGILKSHYDFDFAGAQHAFLKAIELNPNYATARLYYAGGYLTPMGRHAEAIAQMKKTLELDPLSPALHNMLAKTYVWAGQFEAAIEQFRRTIELDSTFALAHFFLAELLLDLGRFDESIAEQERGELLLGASAARAAERAAEQRRVIREHGAPGYWQRNLDLVRQSAHPVGTDYVKAIVRATAYARAGDTQNAVRWLERSYDQREGQELTLIRWMGAFKNLQGDAGFVGVLDRMGLPH
jgi:TolB-like protein/DNA-binding winged helix-turn-helix (wHTH) protein/Tfp pilus assembly protein PilF